MTHKGYITVLGAGAWGTAIAHLLATNGHWVCLYTHEADVAASINQQHCNTKYLPDATLPSLVWATTNATQAAQADELFVATPVPYLREALAPFRGLIKPEHTIVSLSKGIEVSSLKLPLEIIGETVGVCRMGVVGGPNFAADLTQGKLMGTMAASRSPQVVKRISELLKNQYVAVTTTDDVVGVQLCGALKNVIALNLGIVTGQGAADNTRAYLLTQGIADMMTIVDAYHGRRRTVYGLAGLGDTVLSSLCAQGRNYRLGLLLGQGVSLAEALKQFASPPEGLNTVNALHALIERHAFDVPVLSSTCEVVLHTE